VLVSGGKSLFARESDSAGSAQLQNAEGFHELEELVDFTLITGHFDGETGGLHIHNFRAEDIAYLHDLGPGGRGSLDLEQDQFAVDNVAVLEVMDFEDIDEFVELFDNLFENLVVAHDHDGHSGDFVVLRGADIEGVDVESPTAEEAGDPGEDPESVLNNNGNGMSHKGNC